jgi:hypothetical protein
LKIADLKLRITKKYDCGIAVADEHFFKKLRSCGEVSLSCCGIAIMDLKKGAHTHLGHGQPCQILQQLIGVCLVCKQCLFLFHIQHFAIPLAKHNYHRLNEILVFPLATYVLLFVAHCFFSLIVFVGPEVLFLFFSAAPQRSL